MIRALLMATCVLFISFTSATAQITGSVNDDGFIVISGNGDALVGLDFNSVGGFLIPVPPGDLTAPANPFQFLLANSPNQVTFGSLSSELIVDGEIVLDVGYDVSGGDLFAEWGGRASDIPLAFNVTLPEPAAGSIAVLLGVGMLGLRRRRA